MYAGDLAFQKRGSGQRNSQAHSVMHTRHLSGFIGHNPDRNSRFSIGIAKIHL